MRAVYVKASWMGTWIVAVGLVCSALGASGWTILAAMVFTPLVVTMSSRRMPSESVADRTDEPRR
jgi:hypothetical protein